MKHKKQFLIDHYTDFLNQLLEEPFFGDFLVERSYNSYDKLKLNAPLNTNQGCSRAVFWDDNLPYVIKIPFGNRRDCQIEVENYKKAKESGIEELFAECEWLMDFNYNGLSIPIYIMEFVECDENKITDEIYDSYIEGGFDDDFISGLELDSSIEVVEFLSSKWGEEIYSTFVDFCSTNNIDDLHSGNVGFLRGSVVCVDYAGWKGE